MTKNEILAEFVEDMNYRRLRLGEKMVAIQVVLAYVSRIRSAPEHMKDVESYQAKQYTNTQMELWEKKPDQGLGQ
jgi:hypothetical protein